ncbi:high mobility group B protein 15-like [Impatiens glandulifera]|uniref:high mobility group B protein 15-like n=1 Tax=Impatiens glandulifera TaxID=253017 RepID=UPI001FB0F91B|nr:high mobility group B protein 15-like [Impatiens glandulifera]
MSYAVYFSENLILSLAHFQTSSYTGSSSSACCCLVSACLRIHGYIRTEMASSSSSVAAIVKCHPYPPPLAKFEVITVNPCLFMETLEKLHASLGTKFMIPVIGGRDLDLHRLFVQVTSRGGFHKIVKERRWREITATFNFPSTATNASFVLRKYYASLLLHYEQIYLFNAKFWSPSSSADHVSPIPMEIPSLPSSEVLYAGSSVIGVIDGKFENGYLVTITIGSEKLKGVLYQTVETHIQNNDDPPSAGVLGRRRRRRRKSEIRKRDPSRPKPNRSGYNFFFKEQHARLKPLYPRMDRDISRMIGELWMTTNESEKTVYQEKAMEDKERYRLEMDEYRMRLISGQGMIRNPVQIQPVNMVEDVQPEMENISGDGSSNSDDDEEEEAYMDAMSDYNQISGVPMEGEECFRGSSTRVLDLAMDGKGKEPITGEGEDM